MKNIQFITLDVVLAIHDDMIERYGGSFGIRDLGLLQSALARPQSSFADQDLYPSIFEKAAALFHSLIFNHPFLDGNKRTTMSTTARFLFINGLELNASALEFVEFPLRVENKHLSIQEIVIWLKENVKKI